MLLVSVQGLIRSFARGASELHPQENNRLADQHSDSRSSHTESDTNQDGYENDSEGSSKDRDHTVSDTIMVVMVAMTVRLEVDMGGELHSAIWKTVRHSMLGWTLVMVRFGLVVLMTDELVEALHTETLHLVTGALSGCLGLGYSCDDFDFETAQGSLALGVWRVWGDGNGLSGVEDELQSVGFRP